MIAECAKHSMKPVCDHAKSCDASGLFIGQAGSLSTPADRENAQKVPLGFAAISSSWKGACGYRAGNAKAMCNVPASSASWRSAAQSPKFLCGRANGGGQRFGAMLGVRPSRIPHLCALVPRVQGSSGAVATAQFVWRGHAKAPTTRAGPWPDFASRLE